MNKTALRLSAGLIAFAGARYLLQQHDPVHYYYLSSKLRFYNDSMRNIHQHIRKREVFRSAHGEVLELNAGAGLTIPLLPRLVSRYYSNEQNPLLIPAIQHRAALGGCPIHHVENCSSIDILKSMGTDSLDTVILNGALRYESPSSTRFILKEINRVLKPGGYLLFSEDIEFSQQFAPFRKLRSLVRTFFTTERSHDFVPTLLDQFGSAYVEDWSTPALGYHKDHRQHTKLLLEYHQRHSAEQNIKEYFSNQRPLSFECLFRPTVGGFAIKQTPNNPRNSAKLTGSGGLSIDQLFEFESWFVPGKAADLQAKRDRKAKADGENYEQRFMQALRSSLQRAAQKKPTQPRGGYVDNKPIVVNIFSDLFGH